MSLLLPEINLKKENFPSTRSVMVECEENVTLTEKNTPTNGSTRNVSIKNMKTQESNHSKISDEQNTPANYLAKIAKKKPDLRTKKENTIFVKHLKNISFFKTAFTKIHPNADKNSHAYNKFVYECSKVLKHEAYEDGQAVFHAGDIGKTMYFVLDGD